MLHNTWPLRASLLLCWHRTPTQPCWEASVRLTPHPLGCAFRLRLHYLVPDCSSSCATAVPVPGHGPCWAEHGSQGTGSLLRLTSDLPLDWVLSWLPSLDLIYWLTFPAWSWSCVIIVDLSEDLDHHLNLITVPRVLLFLLSSVGSCLGCLCWLCFYFHLLVPFPLPSNQPALLSAHLLEFLSGNNHGTREDDRVLTPK